jgi:hypothetical protein
MTTIIEKVTALVTGNMQRVGAPIPQGASMQRNVDLVNMNHRDKKSVNYARCRAAINLDCNELWKDNAAGAKNFKVNAKKTAIKFLEGKIEWKDGKKFVMFPDGSQARY